VAVCVLARLYARPVRLCLAACLSPAGAAGAVPLN